MTKTGNPKAWIAKAEADFEAAKTLSRSRKRGLPDLVCYHCQQCVEKYLKAYLTFRRVQFPKTHDLEKLLDIVCSFDPLAEAVRSSVQFINPYSISARYPGEEASRAEAKKALRMTSSARKFLQERV
jgi:HEPN domain-containing protein